MNAKKNLNTLRKESTIIELDKKAQERIIGGVDLTGAYHPDDSPIKGSYFECEEIL